VVDHASGFGLGGTNEEVSVADRDIRSELLLSRGGGDEFVEGLRWGVAGRAGATAIDVRLHPVLNAVVA
jgi:hypothetical protein